MAKNTYRIVNDFQVKDARVLELDHDYEFGDFNKARIGEKTFSYTLNSIRNWIIIESKDEFKGKTAEFIRSLPSSASPLPQKAYKPAG